MSDQNPFDNVGLIRKPVPLAEGTRAGMLSVGAIIPAHELQLHDQMRLNAARDFPGAGEVMFEDEESNEAEWLNVPLVYGRKAAGMRSQAERWEGLMQWGVLPSQAEAEAWRRNADAEAFNALSDALVAFRQNWAEAAALAALGDDVWWLGFMPNRFKMPSEYEVAVWLATETSPTAWPAWRARLIKERPTIEARRAAKRAGPVAFVDPDDDV